MDRKTAKILDKFAGMDSLSVRPRKPAFPEGVSFSVLKSGQSLVHVQSSLLSHLELCTTPIKFDGAIVGTGYFYLHHIPASANVRAFLISCLHVFTYPDTTSSDPPPARPKRLQFQCRTKPGELRSSPAATVADGTCDVVEWELDIKKLGPVLLCHPKEDLAAIDLGNLDIAPIEASYISSRDVPDHKTLLAETALLSQLALIGYPTSLHDDENHLPIARVGHASTHPARNFKGKPEGCINIASYEVDSGAPVFYLPQPRLKADGLAVGEVNLWLLGTHHEGYDTHAHYGLDDPAPGDTVPAPLAVAKYLKSSLLTDIESWEAMTFEAAAKKFDDRDESLHSKPIHSLGADTRRLRSRRRQSQKEGAGTEVANTEPKST